MVTVIQERNKFRGLAEALQGIIQGQADRKQRQKQASEISAVNQFLQEPQGANEIGQGLAGPVNQIPSVTAPMAQQLLSQGLIQQRQFGQQQALQQQGQDAALRQAIAIQNAKAKTRSPIAVSQGGKLVDPITGDTIAQGDPKPQSQSQLVAEIGAKIANGSATEEEMGVFNNLTAKAGTTVNLNTGEGFVGSVKEQIAAAAEGQKTLREFEADPANAEILKNTDANIVTNSKGQIQLELRPKAPPAAGQIKELTDMQALVNMVSTAEQLFDDSFVGPVQGNRMLAGLSETTGLGTSSREVQFRRIIKDLGDKLLRARSGAQINEQEYARLQKILPELELSNEAFKGRMKGFKKELSDTIAIKAKASKLAGQRSITDGEPQEDAMPTPKTRADFDAIPKGSMFIDTDGLRKRKL